MNTPLITQNAYAKQRGITHGAVQKAIKSGRLVDCLRPQDGGRVLLDAAIANAEWLANTDSGKPSSTVAKLAADVSTRGVDLPPVALAGKLTYALADVSDTAPIAESRALKEAYVARMAKLEYEERSGALIDADEVRRTAFKATRTARNALMSMPDRLAPVLAGVKDEFECHRLMSAEIKTICDSLAAAGIGEVAA